MHNLTTPREQIADLLQDLKDLPDEYNALLWSWDSADAARKMEAWRLLVQKGEQMAQIRREIERLAKAL